MTLKSPVPASLIIHANNINANRPPRPGRDSAYDKKDDSCKVFHSFTIPFRPRIGA